MYKPKPTPRVTDDICPKHNRRLRDYEIMSGGCQLCALEAKAAKAVTVIHVLPPEPFKCPANWHCKEACNQCIENGEPYIKV